MQEITEIKRTRNTINREDAFHKTGITLSHKEWIGIKAIARKEERSVTGLVRFAIKQYLERYDAAGLKEEGV